MKDITPAGNAALGLLVLATALAGCGGGSTPEAQATSLAGPVAPSPEARQIVAVVDLSTSVSRGDRERYRLVLAELAEELSFGDQLVAFVAHEGGRKAETPTKVLSMPAAVNPARPLDRELKALRSARNYAAASIQELLSSDSVPGTDLFASLHTAADYAHSGGTRSRTLVLLSDMLQCTPGAGQCMEPPRPPFPKSLVERQKTAGTLANLSGLCVSAVGPDPSTAHGVGVRDFWTAYFAEAGADFSTERYRQIVTDVRLLGCGS